MQSAVEADLKQLRWIFTLYERYDSAILDQADPRRDRRAPARGNWTTSWRRTTRGSTTTCFSVEDSVHVPEVVPELSTRRLLTSTWLEGQPILSFVEGHADQRKPAWR